VGAWDLERKRGGKPAKIMTRSKHIDIRYHYVREVISRKYARVFFINGDQNPADMFTKNLGSVKFLKYQGELRLEFLE